MNETPTQSPDQGPEHNPDGLTPEQYGAPEWRLLRVGEMTRETDHVFVNIWKETIEEPKTVSPKDRPYRRRVTPEPTAEQRIAELERKLADIEGPEPYSEEILERRDLVMRINVRDRRIAQLERENAQLQRDVADRCDLIAELERELDGVEPLAGDPTKWGLRALPDQLAQLRAANAQLERERDEARAELEKAWITHGDLRESSERLKDQLAASEKDRQWQPIETAPKDGTKFLVWEVDFKAHRIAWWREHRGTFGDDGYQYNFAHWLPLLVAPTQSETL